MTKRGLENFQTYQKSMELFDFVAEDMKLMKEHRECGRLVSQQLASADSMCANIEEGYGRLSRAEYIRFLDFARGSARETLGRYKRMRHWLPSEVVQHRTALASEIVGMLTATMVTLRKQQGAATVREEHGIYLTGSENSNDPRPSPPPSTLDTRHLTLS